LFKNKGDKKMRENEERECEREGDGEGWQTITKRKRSSFIQTLDKITTSFFFTNFPEDASSGDLWSLFLKFGRVREVYIPKKLDKMGKRFGFVKFKEVGGGSSRRKA
jgi:RNA recognition motif-containing protein